MRVEVLMSLHDEDPHAGHSEVALLANEQRLARSLVDLIRDSDVDLYANVDSELRKRRHEIMETTSAKAAYLRKISGGTLDSAAVIRVTQELDTAMTKLEVLEAQIRARDPRIGRFKKPQQSTVAVIQNLLDADSVMLYYFLGKRRSFLWMVTPSSIESFVLPPRAEIDDLARSVYGELSHLTFGVPCSGQEEMLELSKLLLGPVWQQLTDKRLVIIPDGVLSYIAFSALPDLSGKQQKSGGCYAPLLDTHEVVYLPSATVLFTQRSTYAKRPQTRSAVAVFSDPVYSENDIRHQRGGDLTVDSNSQLGTSVNDGNDAQFPTYAAARLVATRREAMVITGSSSRWQVDTFVGFDANKNNFVKHAMNGYRVIHLAAHGILDSQRPRLSSVLLSQFSAEGQTQDGYLRLQDIFGLKLNSDLIVLSGCETALGREIRGEGLVGLTRGFMYAGAKAVVASLWRVDDAATAEFMRQFYFAMMENNEHPSAALRYAKLEIARDRKWRNPYFWAAFILQGDWQ